MENVQAGERQKTPLFHHLLMNPIARKLTKVQERDEAHGATYGGITRKSIFFLLLTVVGLGLYFFIHQQFDQGLFIEVENYRFSIYEIYGVAAAAVFTVFSPFLIWLVRPLIPVFGILYCLGQGFLLAWAVGTFGDIYEFAAWAALGITIVIVFSMLVLYSCNIVKVNHKFRSVVTTLFLASILCSLAFMVCSFVPQLQGIYSFIMENMVVSILGSVVFIILATLFLLVDFDCIRNTVEEKLPKKYEWVAAMALVFTVIWLYFKVLNLILKLTTSKNR